MKKLPLLLALVLTLTIMSCGQKNDNAKAHQSEQTNTHKEDIKLNDGKKWKVNEEMASHIEFSEELVKNYIKSGEKDYLNLARELNESKKNLVSSCTMKGEAHDNLHTWLHPYIGLLQKLEASKNENTAQETVLEIEEAFKTYRRYFE
ncbi:hypothetical protein RCC89_10645 [Cytophagaceae bacterium ABcell3]|nr:hypothetical protein RCC89_10645 [Cytophagaceae bacterium ABcell3]